ncbi:hypothetical protein AB0O51_33435 [Streptomyces sp. NPDC090301]|uniref:hypothetical protein n=1 Tax=Streptomyces sp. NPDC090301 TaxID=3154975 RepID=UPI00341966E4
MALRNAEYSAVFTRPFPVARASEGFLVVQEARDDEHGIQSAQQDGQGASHVAADSGEFRWWERFDRC